MPPYTSREELFFFLTLWNEKKKARIFFFCLVTNRKGSVKSDSVNGKIVEINRVSEAH